MKRAAARRGVSLMEVLIGTFVLSVGLLGLAALIPVGRLAIVETGKSDRAGACGRAALRDVKVRQMLNPALWRNVDLSPVVDLNSGVDATRGGESFAIDPLMIARDAAGSAPQTTLIARFPYFDPNGQQPQLPTMRRVTLADRTTNLPPGLPSAERIFTWHDDLLFDIPREADQRPHLPLDSGGNFLFNAYQGNYSWLLTVTPAVAETATAAAQKNRYLVSAVVFYKRDLAVDPGAVVPSERTVTAEMIGGGYGGGDVRLSCTNPAWLKVKENQWLMLCGQSTALGPPGNPNPIPSGVFRWYRVVAAAEIDPANPGSRFITLAGPDWDPSWCPGGGGVCEAALFDGVIGVYCTTVELDRSPLW